MKRQSVFIEYVQFGVLCESCRSSSVVLNLPSYTVAIALLLLQNHSLIQ